MNGGVDNHMEAVASSRTDHLQNLPVDDATFPAVVGRPEHTTVLTEMARPDVVLADVAPPLAGPDEACDGGLPAATRSREDQDLRVPRHRAFHGIFTS